MGSLGYYNRARNLKAAAIQIMDQFDGCIPSSKEELLTLPGIGSYTAGAISSIAYGVPNPAVDGNVLRVISRLQGDYSDIKKASVKTAMEQEIAAVMPKDAASSYNQGLIEIGAWCVFREESQDAGNVRWSLYVLQRKRDCGRRYL